MYPQTRRENDPTFVSELLKISSAFTPPPQDGFVSLMTWGVENQGTEQGKEAGTFIPATFMRVTVTV
jgi:hypothetical protein